MFRLSSWVCWYIVSWWTTHQKVTYISISINLLTVKDPFRYLGTDWRIIFRWAWEVDYIDWRWGPLACVCDSECSVCTHATTMHHNEKFCNKGINVMCKHCMWTYPTWANGEFKILSYMLYAFFWVYIFIFINHMSSVFGCKNCYGRLEENA